MAGVGNPQPYWHSTPPLKKIHPAKPRINLLPRKTDSVPLIVLLTSAMAATSASHAAAPAAISGTEALWSAGVGIIHRDLASEPQRHGGRLRDTTAKPTTARQRRRSSHGRSIVYQIEETSKVGCVVHDNKIIESSSCRLLTEVYTAREQTNHITSS
jgi:hypothetical protein